MKGRKPKPLAVRAAEGTKPRGRHRKQPTPAAGKPTPPSHLDDAARKEWARVLKATPPGLLSKMDVAVLAVYCVSFARWAEAEVVVRRAGEVIKTTNGNYIQNPWLGIANRAAAATQKAAVELGLSPTARARVSVLDGAREDDGPAESIDDFLDAPMRMAQ